MNISMQVLMPEKGVYARETCPIQGAKDEQTSICKVILPTMEVLRRATRLGSR